MRQIWWWALCGFVTLTACTESMSFSSTRGGRDTSRRDSIPAKLTAGSSFNCVLVSNGAISCWGDNEFGQLGIVNSDYDSLV
eukprot:CAMPEP_0113715078 /NCGR_PEP_ID=MMETSP0038_2-20120614/33041_1 /TAXON_ID=2898 /ORGANISM="Cryptomonas paramecium" /LENGTH=81 /DNA_ID=CAMNT_0000642263 /DNA_START=11 /DNA_END=253 /DNA_ORIENTATION=- /assembly_acc=CAM_ASM_000170